MSRQTQDDLPPGVVTSPDERDTLASECEDAYVDGDRPYRSGTARAAFANQTFRIVYLGAFASNIGTWMQNVVLGAIAYNLTESAVFVGVMMAAQLGPLLVFSMVGGMLADAFDRKKVLIVLSIQQAVFSLLLALVTIPDKPSLGLLVAIVFCIGVGNSLYAPVFSAVVPMLVPKRDMAGAISLNSVQMNASRVVGPIIGTAIYAKFGSPWVFVLNAASFAAVIVSLTWVELPKPPATGSQGLHRILDGLEVARKDRVVGQCLVTIFTFSLLSLPFITQMPKIASVHLAIGTKSSAYGLLYACFGIGAVVGALSVGTVFARSPKPRLTRICLAGFAVMLVIFSSLRSAITAYGVIMILGGVYFAVITSLATVLQQAVDDKLRGKVMALWIMGFGGTVPFGGLAGGWFIERVGIMPVLGFGASVAVALAIYADLQPVRKPFFGRSGSGDRSLVTQEPA